MHGRSADTPDGRSAGEESPVSSRELGGNQILSDRSGE